MQMFLFSQGPWFGLTQSIYVSSLWLPFPHQLPTWISRRLFTWSILSKWFFMPPAVVLSATFHWERMIPVSFPRRWSNSRLVMTWSSFIDIQISPNMIPCIYQPRYNSAKVHLMATCFPDLIDWACPNVAWEWPTIPTTADLRDHNVHMGVHFKFHFPICLQALL